MTDPDIEAKQAYTTALLEEFLAILDISRETIDKLGARYNGTVSTKELLTLVAMLLIEASIAGETPVDILVILLTARIPAVEKVISVAREQSGEAKT